MKYEGELRRFKAAVWHHSRTAGRHDLPWRKTRVPYRILVSEVMLQQTQVSRVIEKYHQFLKAFPTPAALANAPLSEVLRVWVGLGYNRRAKYLHAAARHIVKHFRGDMRRALAETLPGVGPYTRAAVRVFAWNEPVTMIETNIRSAFIHHFFPQAKRVHDRELIPLIEKAAEGENPREWHWALMDYGAHLKKTTPNPSRRSAHHTKQSKFEGSLREARGAIVRALSRGESLTKVKRLYSARFDIALASLKRDGLVKGGVFKDNSK